ncbi:EcsC family protein [Fictibacillus gelatini]|uniref:EcsC family protein n=1 Tax=Fictibacillus gelatini TaxID=225985 RepID=UPI000428B7EB|nr:EcsC family protein [Fictibacillus gelatini]
MESYSEIVQKELSEWQKEVTRKPSLWNKSTKTIQTKVNDLIPDKVHNVITKSIKNMVHAVLVGSEYTTKRFPLKEATLEERDKKVDEKIQFYKKTALIEGAGTGAGGILLGLADFPLLLSIKLKFLFDVASLYGFDVKDYRERLFILHVFQLAYSSPFKRKEVYEKVANWNETVNEFPTQTKYLEKIEWKELQQDYRDHIDLAKMLQLVPGIGAVVGAYANYQFLEDLGKTAKNCFRLRVLQNETP